MFQKHNYQRVVIDKTLLKAFSQGPHLNEKAIGTCPFSLLSYNNVASRIQFDRKFLNRSEFHSKYDRQVFGSFHNTICLANETFSHVQRLFLF